MEYDRLHGASRSIRSLMILDTNQGFSLTYRVVWHTVGLYDSTQPK